MNEPTAALHLLFGTTLVKKGVQPLSKKLVSEPKLCVEMSPFFSSFYLWPVAQAHVPFHSEGWCSSFQCPVSAHGDQLFKAPAFAWCLIYILLEPFSSPFLGCTYISISAIWTPWAKAQPPVSKLWILYLDHAQEGPQSPGTALGTVQESLSPKILGCSWNVFCPSFNLT